MLKLDDILRTTGGQPFVKILSRGAEVFSGVSTDSRTIKEGELFIALRGEKFDGHDFLGAALKTAAGAVIDREEAFKPEIENTGKSVLLVEDTLKTLQALARFIRMKRPRMPVVGITGSNGKTTTKELAALVLGQRFEVLKSLGNLNNQIGLPLNLCRLEDSHGAAVLEMGASRPGDIKELCDIAVPTHGIITNIGESHLEGFSKGKGGDPMQTLMDTKLDLARAAGAVVYNADDPRLSQAVLDEFNGKKALTLMSFGIEKEADLRAGGIVMERGASAFELFLKGQAGKVKVRLRAAGLFNIHNALAAMAAGLLFGITLEEGARAIEGFSGVPMRYEIRERGGALVLSDVYNANPASMGEAIKELLRLKGQRAVAVLGDMLELGKYAEEAHKNLGARLAALPVDVFIAVGPMMALACEEFIKSSKGFGNGKLAVSCADSGAAGETLKNNLRPGDTVLIKGSRGVRMEKVLEGISA